MKRLQEISDRHENELAKFGGRIDTETRDRQQADQREAAQRERLKQELQGSIREAAAIGLTGEWAGTFLVLAGLVLVEVGRYLS